MLGWHKSLVSLHGPTKKNTFCLALLSEAQEIVFSNSVAGLNYSSDC